MLKSIEIHKRNMKANAEFCNKDSKLREKEADFRNKENTNENMLRRLEIQEQKLKDETDFRNGENAKRVQLLKQRHEELNLREQEIDSKEADIKIIDGRKRDLEHKEEQISIAEADIKKREHELFLRAESLQATEIEFGDKLKKEGSRYMKVQ